MGRRKPEGLLAVHLALLLLLLRPNANVVDRVCVGMGKGESMSVGLRKARSWGHDDDDDGEPA